MTEASDRRGSVILIVAGSSPRVQAEEQLRRMVLQLERIPTEFDTDEPAASVPLLTPRPLPREGRIHVAHRVGLLEQGFGIKLLDAPPSPRIAHTHADGHADGQVVLADLPPDRLAP